MELTSIKYDFSFTASSLRLNEMLYVTDAHQKGVEVDYTNVLVCYKNLSQKKYIMKCFLILL